MPDAIKRYKDRQDFTPAEELEFQRSRTRPENPDWVEAARSALKGAGLEADDVSPSVSVADMSVDDHFARIRSGR